MTFPGLRNINEPMFIPSPKGMQMEYDAHCVSLSEMSSPDHIVVAPPPGLGSPSKLERRTDSSGMSSWYQYFDSRQDVGNKSATFEPAGRVAEAQHKLDSSEHDQDALWQILQTFTSPLDESIVHTPPLASQGYVMGPHTRSSHKADGGANAAVWWWKKVRAPLCCPLSGFPIALLPYPPFKLRLDPSKPSPYKLVDGKYLALQVAASGSLNAGIRELTSSDVTALDEYMTRCKLGPYRLGRVLAMTNKLAEARSEQKKSKLSDEVASFCKGARKELLKLRRIQKNRMEAAAYSDKTFDAAAAWSEEPFDF